MSAGKRAVLVRRLICNAMVVVAATAIFGFKAAERAAAPAASPLEIASR
jgi:hypothetical protein